MIIIKPSIEFVDNISNINIIKKIEKCGRVAYKSEDNITIDSAERFISKIIKMGHESVIEHYSVTIKIVCDRGISHELVRHRLASYTQESTRFCNYSKDHFNNNVTFILPCWFSHLWNFATQEMIEFDSPDNPEMRAFKKWFDLCQYSEQMYFDLLALGQSPQQARSVLPNSLKTELIMTANLREWRHILKLRISKRAHPQMREIASMILRQFKIKIPSVFDDIQME